MNSGPTDIHALVDENYRAKSRRVSASLVRLVRDFDLAEEALHEAFAVAVERWAEEGAPDNPRAWLVSTGRFKAIDSLRRRDRLDTRQPELAGRLSEIAEANAARASEGIEDDRLHVARALCGRVGAAAIVPLLPGDHVVVGRPCHPAGAAWSCATWPSATRTAAWCCRTST